LTAEVPTGHESPRTVGVGFAGLTGRKPERPRMAASENHPTVASHQLVACRS
jgi:hypothetical protein